MQFIFIFSMAVRFLVLAAILIYAISLRGRCPNEAGRVLVSILLLLIADLGGFLGETIGLRYLSSEMIPLLFGFLSLGRTVLMAAAILLLVSAVFSKSRGNSTVENSEMTSGVKPAPADQNNPYQPPS